MKRKNETSSVVQERTSMKDKSSHRNAQHSGRPNVSQNTINPNRGLNEDEQKRRTNQEEEDETTNAYSENSSQPESSRKEKSSDSDDRSNKRNQSKNN